MEYCFRKRWGLAWFHVKQFVSRLTEIILVANPL